MCWMLYDNMELLILNIEKVNKMIFCKHKYRLYNVGEYYTLFGVSPYTCFKFICEKCGKEKTLYSVDIKNEIDYLEDNVRRQIILRNQLEEYNDKSFFVMKIFPMNRGIYYEGKHIDMLKKKYKKKYNIDLDEISHLYKGVSMQNCLNSGGGMTKENIYGL